MADIADWINDQYDDEWAEFEQLDPQGVQCMYCGQWGYEWGLTSNGWRLFTLKTHHLHSCKSYSETKTVIPNPVKPT